MKVEKVETIRVRLNDGFYVDITPNGDSRDFWLYRDGWGVSEFMFGMAVTTDDEAIELAIGNAEDYIQMLEDRCV